MKSERNILIAFLLNLFFSIFEFFGGLFTNSVAIMSDAIHDLGDAISIGCAYFLERKSKKKADTNYTYGYLGYSVIGAIITSTILICGSVGVCFAAIKRFMNPEVVDYKSMIVFAIFGVVVNLVAAFVTREKNSLNQRAVNLHMLEDTLGWFIVLIGSIIMKFTNFVLIDSIMSFIIALFILKNAVSVIVEALSILLMKTPTKIDIEHLVEHISKIDGVENVHHLHIWSLDGNRNCATVHIVSKLNSVDLKNNIRKEFEEFGVNHTTIEIEESIDDCTCVDCSIGDKHSDTCCHHHHHHHHHH